MMFRIRRKIVFIISGSVFTVSLCFYALMSYSMPAPEKQAELNSIKDKLQYLERGFEKHVAEVSIIKDKIDSIQQQDRSPGHDSSRPITSSHRSSIFNRDPIGSVDTCSLSHIQTDPIPKPDIQMLTVYDTVQFDNPDGGEWKQGWRIKYEPNEWNQQHRLNVFVVPHSHNDPGWIKTFDEYYEQQTKLILTNMLAYLTENPTMTFIWAEISYFARWYEPLTSKEKRSVQLLLKRNQLEFVTGGWVMPDEANSHWIGILQQLTEGQQWLKRHFNVTPVTSWAIDPFGYSGTMPILLKGSGFQNLLIQRVHYSIKKYLAIEKELEFRWRSLWDATGESDLFTHLMPFYSYDVPHTCGPDPKICCQFDFKRLPGYGVYCPWKIPPAKIDNKNVGRKADLIIDQWRKKAKLYKTRSVLIPLGDDFRYSQSTEWEAQHRNFDKLFNYINNEPQLNVRVKFSTLQEYFDAVHDERRSTDFPSLSGDFFTYADRDDHYWSGYYTSRPYHKRLDRILMMYLRSAEMLSAWKQWDNESGFDVMLRDARRALSLFQHHDGVAGTARDHVMRDYANMMQKALSDCQFVMQQAVYRLLTKPTIYQPDLKFHYFNIDDSRSISSIDIRPTIILGPEIPTKYIVIHNSLPYEREELVEFYVSKPFVMVKDLNGRVVRSQIMPVWSWHKNPYTSLAPQVSSTKYKLVFMCKVSPLGLKTYVIHSTDSVESSIETTFAKITLFTTNPFTVKLPDYPIPIEFSEPRDITLGLDDRSKGYLTGGFNQTGLLKSITIDQQTYPVNLEFLRYGARKTRETSGAYLFLPDGPAIPFQKSPSTILLITGELESSITTGMPFVIHTITIRSGERSLEIRNNIDIGDMRNTEIVMRLSTGITNSDTFYTDLNGFQYIKRRRLEKIPLQANYYPIASGMYIEDPATRLTLLTGQPLGGSSLSSGQFEIMQERRLNQDDNRGLGHGVEDNQPIMNIFKLLVENIKPCTVGKRSVDYPAGFLTETAHFAYQTLQHPMEKFVWHDTEWSGVLSEFGERHRAVEAGVELAVFRSLQPLKNSGLDNNRIGVVLHRTNLEECENKEELNLNGMINLPKILGWCDIKEIFTAPLTLLRKEKRIDADVDVPICPMDIKAFIIERPADDTKICN